MVRTRKKSAMSESEDEVATAPARRSSRRSSRSTTKVLYEEDDIDPEALQAVLEASEAGDGAEAPVETKPKRGRKPKSAGTTPVKAAPKKRGRKSNAQKKAEAEAEEAALLANIQEEPEPEEAKAVEAVAKEPESASEAVPSDQNGKSGQVISSAAEPDTLADDQNEPKETEPTPDVSKDPEPESLPEPEPEPEPTQEEEKEAVPEPEKVEEGDPEKADEPFEMVEKEDLPEEEPIEKVDAPVGEEEKMSTEDAEEGKTDEAEKKEENGDLPDFEDEEEEEQNADALQLDANVEEDDDLNKTVDIPKVDASRKREASAEVKKQRSPSPPRKRESLNRTGSRREKIRAPSPPPGEESQVVHITNLVRPFTNKQLLEYLKEAGEFDEESFWIDRIKSNCLVKYNTLESAVNSRKLIHGKNWPSSNPKELRVVYSTEEKLKAAKENGTVSSQNTNGRQRSPVRRFGGMRSEHEFERDRKTGRDRRSPVRAPRAKTESPVQSEESEGEGGISLDELFKKTKATPSLYWLPLTEDEVIARDKAREERRKAREERRKQSDDKSRAERRRSNSRDRPARRSRSRKRSVSRSRKSVSRRRSFSRKRSGSR